MSTVKKYLPMKLTRQGKQLLAKVQSGVGNIRITRFATGSGIYQDGEDYSLREDLKEPKQEFLISSKTVETDDSVVMEVEITNCPEEGEGLETGYKIREMAFFAENPEGGEICYCIMVGTDDLMMDYLPAYDGTIPSTITSYFHIKVANAGKVEIVIKTGNIVNSEEGANGLRIYQRKLQYLNSQGEWRDLNVDGSSIIIGDMPEIEEEIPELSENDSLGRLFGKMKKILGLKVDKKGGDITDTVVSSLENSTEAFPVPAAEDNQKTLWGKLKKWQQDCLAKFGNYVLTSMITNQHLNDTNRVPSSALVYLMQQAITQLNMDLEHHSISLNCPYMDMAFIRSGRVATLYSGNEIKMPMYEGYTYTLGTLPVSCPHYYIMILVGNGSFGFLKITNNVVTFEPYARNFSVGDWIYIHQSLILY